MAEEDNIEMKDLDRFREVEREIADDEETNIDSDRVELLERKKQNLRSGGEHIQRVRDPNVSITVPQGFNPDIEGVPETPKGLKRIFTNDRKIFLKNALNVSLNKGDHLVRQPSTHKRPTQRKKQRCKIQGNKNNCRKRW